MPRPMPLSAPRNRLKRHKNFLTAKAVPAHNAWRRKELTLKYHFLGKETLISLGFYPATSLKGAREKTADARKTLENDTAPAAPTAKIVMNELTMAGGVAWYAFGTTGDIDIANIRPRRSSFKSSTERRLNF